MAGIGFELNRLFKKSNSNPLLASLWSALSCVGSMIFSFLMLLFIQVVSSKIGVHSFNLNAFTTYLTNIVFLSMLIYSIVSYPISRYVSDQIYLKKYTKIIPSFWGALLLLVFSAIVIFVPIAVFSKLDVIFALLLLVLLIVLLCVWLVIGYVTILKNYKKICFSFLGGALASILTYAIGVGFNAISTEYLLFIMLVGYAVIFVILYIIFDKSFTGDDGKSYEFLKVYSKYPTLVLTSMLMTIGTLLPFYIMWYSESGTIVNGFFRNNALFDLPAIIAYLSSLPTVIYFVVSLEPNFYPHYKKYFALLNSKGTYANVLAVKNDMINTLKKQLKHMTYMQLTLSVAFTIFGSFLLSTLNIGFNQDMLGTFRFLCVGYFFFALGNSIILVFLYFSDYKRSLLLSALYTLLVGVFTYFSLSHTNLFGLGVLVGAFIMCVCGILLLQKLVNNLDYYVLSKNEIFTKEERYPLYAIVNKFDTIIGKIISSKVFEVVRIIVFLIVSVFLIWGAYNSFRIDTGDTVKFLKNGRTLVFYPQTSKKILKNPGVGFAPWANSKNTLEFDSTLVYVNLSFKELEPSKGVFDFKSFEEKNYINEYKKQNRQAVFRFYMDYPSDSKHMDIPQWLYDEIKGDGTWYDNEYGMGFSPNYENEVLIKYYEEAVKALANRYGADNFFIYIEMGALGHWGEYHVNRFVDIPKLPSFEVRREYIEPFASGFSDAYILMRVPVTESSVYGTGLYNDVIGDEIETKEWLKSQTGGIWSQTGERELVDRTNAWKSSPIGGEFTSAYAAKDILGKNAKSTIKLIEESHQSFIGPKIIVDEGKGSFGDTIDKIRYTLGHRLFVNEVDVKSTKKNTTVTVSVKNDGIAPIYTKVNTMLYLYDAVTGKLLKTIDATSEYNVNSISGSVPGKFSVSYKNDVVSEFGRYKLCIALTDGEGKPIIELANSIEHSDRIYNIASWKTK